MKHGLFIAEVYANFEWYGIIFPLFYVSFLLYCIHIYFIRAKKNPLFRDWRKSMNKNCIFHIPNFIDPNRPSGSQIRPIKMLNAFRNIGYEVDVVMGYGKERKKQILGIKKNIKNGKKYDFIYSESSTMPTLLTEKHHLPTYPFLDFSFLKFCKKKDIKIGLFYRDVHWNFPVYKENVNIFKRKFAVSFYKYDLKQYQNIIDIFYLPSVKVYDYIPFIFKGDIEELPPAIDESQSITNNKISTNNEILEVFYVGGIGDIYNLELIFKVTQQLKFINLTVCCRKEDWEKERYRYEKYLNPRIKVIHKFGIGIRPYYENANLMCMYLKPSIYWSLAMPVKLFEYIGSGKPILSTNCTVADKFIKEYDIGWSAEYSYDALVSQLKHIYNNQIEIIEKSNNIKAIRTDNTWEARARKVAYQLSNR